MDLVSFLLNTGVALSLGLVIGLERQFGQHPAGLRTNALVCVGAALFVTVGCLVDTDSSRTRIAAQIVSGIGFLGGGVILREGLTVRGLNTAATLWCSAAIGTLAGFGLLPHAAIGATAVLLVNFLLRPIVHQIDLWMKKAVSVDTHYRVRVICPADQATLIRTILLRHINSELQMTVQGMTTQDTDRPGQSVVVAEIFATQRNDRYLNDVVARLSIEPSVSSVSWEKAS